MAVCVEIDALGVVRSTGDLIENCQAFALVSAPEFSHISSFSMPTAEELLWLYTWGLGAILLPWSLGYAIGVAKKTINRV